MDVQASRMMHAHSIEGSNTLAVEALLPRPAPVNLAVFFGLVDGIQERTEEGSVIVELHPRQLVKKIKTQVEEDPDREAIVMLRCDLLRMQCS